MHKVPRHLIKEWLIDKGRTFDTDPNLNEIVKKVCDQIDTPYNRDIYNIYNIFKARGWENDIGIVYLHLN